jgi:hypothetical protein
VPFYCLNSSGLFGFFYADLGPYMPFQYKNPKNLQETLEKEITDSKPLSQFLNHFTNTEDPSLKLKWGRKIKGTKFLLLSILSQYIKEKNI